MLRVFTSILLLNGSTFAQFPMVGRLPVSKSGTDAEHQNPSEWGMQSNGLRCRAVLPASIEHNETIEARLECIEVPESRPAEIIAVNPRRGSNFTLEFVNSETEEKFILPAETGYGLPRFDDGRMAQQFKEVQIFEWSANFPTVRMEPPLPVGEYKATITFAQSAEPNPLWRGTRDEWIAHGYWWGMLETGERTLRITEESPKTIVLHVPTRLRLVRREFEVPGQKIPGYYIVTYKTEDSEELVVPTRSGHWMGTSYETGRSRGGLQSGPIAPGFEMGPHRQDKNGDIDGVYKIHVFETCSNDPHFVQSCGYKVLWEKTFDFHASAAEIAVIVPEVIRPRGSPPDTN